MYDQSQLLKNFLAQVGLFKLVGQVTDEPALENLSLTSQVLLALATSTISSPSGAPANTGMGYGEAYGNVLVPLGVGFALGQKKAGTHLESH